MKPEAALFDLDGTLVDSAPGIVRALNQVRAERGGEPLQAAAVRPWISLGADALVAAALGPFARRPDEDLQAFRSRLLDLPADPADVYPGVTEALEALADAGLQMAVVTNKPEGLSVALLDQLDLSRWFGAVVGGDTTARPKPDPAPSRAALQALGREPDGTVFVGDSRVDADAADGIGMPFYLYEGGYGAADCPDALVAARFARFAELPGLLGC